MFTRLAPFRCLTGIAFGLGLAAHAAAGPDGSMEERLRRLEGEVGALQKENQELRSELGLEDRSHPTLVTPAGHERVFSVGGMLQVQADFGDKGDARFTSGNDRFYLRRARINVQGKFLEFDFRVEGEFAGSLGETNGTRGQLTDGYITWNRFPGANVRLGQFKTPFGYEQLAGDPGLFTIERTLVNDRLTIGRQIGAQVAGNLFDQRISYATGLFNGTGANTNANDNDKFMWIGRLSAIAWQGLLGGKPARWTVGANALRTNDSTLSGQPADFGFDSVPGGAKDNIFSGKREAGGLDTQFKVGQFELWLEYLRQRFEPVDATPSHRFDSDGWYLTAGYFVIPKTLQTVLRYDEYDPNLGIAANGTRTWTIGANYFFKSDDLKLQFNYLITDVDGQSAQNRKLMMRLQTVF